MKTQKGKLKKKLIPLINPNKQPPQKRVSMLSVKSVSTNDVLDKFHKEKSKKRKKLFSIRPGRNGKSGKTVELLHNKSVPHFNIVRSDILYLKNKADNQAIKKKIISQFQSNSKSNMTRTLIKSLKDRFVNRKKKHSDTTTATNKAIMNVSNATALFKKSKAKNDRKAKKNISFGFYQIDTQEQSVDFDCDKSSPVIKRKVFDTITMDTPIKPKSEISNRLKFDNLPKRRHELKRLNKSELKSAKRPEFPWKTPKDFSKVKNVRAGRWLIKSEFNSKRQGIRLK